MEIKVDAKDWQQFGNDLKAFDPALYRGLRAALREAGKSGVEGVKGKLAEPSPADGPDTGRGRAQLAAATRVAVSFAKRGGSVKITTSPSRLPAEHKGLLAVYNMHQFRHPLFGDKEHWQEQPGKPYFYGAIMRAGHREMAKGVEAAIGSAFRAIGAK